jgi:hypothetical protein
MQIIIYQLASGYILLISMQFFQMRDSENKTWHNYLIIQVSKEGYLSLKAQITQASVNCWPVIQNGKPTVVFGYGASINLSESFGSGETLGEKIHAGDIVTVILTDKPQEQIFTRKETGLGLNFALEDVTIHPFTYTKEMEQIYEIYQSFTTLKDSNSQNEAKSKTKRLGFR